MDDARWERLAAATGIGFVVLLLIGNLLGGAPPKADDPVSEIIDYALDQRTSLLAGSYLEGLAVVLGLWFLGSLRSYLRRAERGTGRLSAVAFGGGLLAAGVSLVVGGVGNAILLRVAEEGDPAVVRALFDLRAVMVASIWFPTAAWVAATSIVAMRAGAFPRWYGLAGPVLTLVFLVAGAGIYVDEGPLAPGEAFGLVTFILFALWVLVTSVLLIQRVGRPAATPAGQAPQLTPD